MLALAGGCADVPRPGAPPAEEQAAKPADPANVNLSGFSPAFKQGYAAGCDSARSGRRRRDESRYEADADYLTGWNDGYSICRR